MNKMRVAVLTISDKGSRGERADTSGDAIAELVGESGEVVERAIVPDDGPQISAALTAWSDAGIDLILTTGGTGLSARDVTPEATLAIADKTVPGIPEAMRAAGAQFTQKAMLSRAVAVIRKQTLIINLPGSEKGVRESLGAVLEQLPHAVDLLRGHTEHTPPPSP